MRLLHVAAMPFPSVQGTQAAVRAMIDAEHAAGMRPELCTYAHGADGAPPPWPIHRIADLARDRSLRSGPSWRKLVADAQLAIQTRRTASKMEPRAIVAHHVEAASAVLAARLRPTVFFAHTALGPELPTYLPGRAHKIAARAGETLELALAHRSDVVLAISPRLARDLSERARREVSFVPVPWKVPAASDAAERAAARARFDLSPLEAVFLYAGNLDAYQGLDVLVRAFAAAREHRADARLLVATSSDREGLIASLREAGCADRVRFAPIEREDDRRAVHAAADVVWSPRAAAGGLPIKLLDALARGAPTIATRRATAELPLENAAWIVADDDPRALAAAALLAIEARSTAIEIGRRGVEYVRREHTAERYLEAMGAALENAR
jgi:glycosyltransferase involved in cell wall biosynthesis